MYFSRVYLQYKIVKSLHFLRLYNFKIHENGPITEGSANALGLYFFYFLPNWANLLDIVALMGAFLIC